ncbi:MAG: ATP phosphoribosyltransferase regulatory subunit [Bacteroidales bacterium]|nr:ATP phosphoribosyltransferase regulatory subunit [Bacteroidales bacterium]MCM1416646.1 ATP phosphoribosyltransferase regulatory subunit [bacterium]MCM1424784.1 ATP phosphoribosyltransferase regulatory subunit [bacterium]
MSRKLVHTPEGVRDIYGEEKAKKTIVERLLKEKIHSFGYRDIQTPTFEFFDVFSKEVGTTPSKELYKFFDKEGNTLVLRPDFTPSIARCAAKYFMDEEVPIRLCYQGNTFTNTSDLQGKLKEATQMGAELIGDASVQADAEMIALTIESLFHAGLSDFQISVGNLEYFKGICAQAGLDEETELTLREYISGKNYFGAEELLESVRVAGKDKELLLKVSDLFGQVSILEEAKKTVSNKRSRNALERLEKVYQALCDYGVEKYVSFDLGMLSKYNYYTGIIFKGYTYGVGDAIVKGGRYDRLLPQFGKDAAAIGFVIVVDDLLLAMARQDVAVAGIEEPLKLYYTEADFKETLREAKKLRAAGKKVELLPKA